MADNRIAYGLAKRYGINTEGMTPGEVWEALAKKGITQDNAYSKKLEGDTEKREKAKKIYEDDGVRLTKQEIKFSPSKPKEFRDTLKSAKETNDLEARWRVTLHDESEYKDTKLYTTNGGSCVGVTRDGDIVSVCKNQNANEKSAGKTLLKKAVEEGGNKLDAYGPKLYALYTKNGFEPISWTEWDDEYAPDEWKEAKKQGIPVEREPIIFYKYTGKGTDESYKDFLARIKPSESYDEAYQSRDKEIRR